MCVYIYTYTYVERGRERERTVKCIPEQGIVMYHKCIKKSKNVSQRSQ